MTLLQTIDKYEKLAKSKNAEERHAALLFALQIPSILSRMEYPQTPDNTGLNKSDPNNLYKPSGDTWDKHLYKHWIIMHKNEFPEFFYSPHVNEEDVANSIYGLRNSFTHAGILPTSYQTFILADTGGCGLCLPHVMFLSTVEFCDIMFSAARNSLSKLRLGHSEIRLEVPANAYVEKKKQLTQLYDDFWAARTDRWVYDKYRSFFYNPSEEKLASLQQDENVSTNEYNAICALYHDWQELEKQVDQIVLTLYST